ncbi:MAG: biotin transporter BioY [Cellulosilyticum sp.]|nr:biotin transporter BioY [Cellulosilyticum sp.]
MQSRYSVKEQMLVGLCAALIMIFAQISIPVPFSVVPITFQAFAVILVAIIIEDQLAIRTLCIYTLLGGIGLPVFSGFSGGFPRIFGPTGGFIIGFILMAFIIGWASRKNNKMVIWIGTYSALMLDYVIGTTQLAFVTHMPFKEAMVIGVLPFLPKDIILAAVAIIVATRIKGVVRKRGLGIC